MIFSLEDVTINARSIAICYFSLLQEIQFRKLCLPTFGGYDSFLLSISLIACVCEYVDRMYTHSWTYRPTRIRSPPDPWTTAHWHLTPEKTLSHYVTIYDRSIAICHFSLLREIHFRKLCIPTFGGYDSFLLALNFPKPKKDRFRHF